MSRSVFLLRGAGDGVGSNGHIACSRSTAKGQADGVAGPCEAQSADVRREDVQGSGKPASFFHQRESLPAEAGKSGESAEDADQYRESERLRRGVGDHHDTQQSDEKTPGQVGRQRAPRKLLPPVLPPLCEEIAKDRSDGAAECDGEQVCHV